MNNKTFASIRNATRAVVHRVPVLVAILALAAATSSAFADDRHRGNGPRFKPNHGASHYRDNRHHAGHANRFGNTRGRSQWNRSWNSNQRFTNNRFYSNTTRYRHHDHDNWSVSLNFGSGYSSWNSGSLFYGSGFYDNTWAPRRTRTSVIYNQPTVVYVNETRPVTTRVVTTTRAPRTSLLRDLYGDCYERTIDSRGRETRTRLPDSACNF